MTTTLTRFEPFANTLRLPDAIEQLLNESWVSPRSFFGWSTNSMPLDLSETDDAYAEYTLLRGDPGATDTDHSVGGAGAADPVTWHSAGRVPA